jgi:hypothetical protein
VGDAFLSACEWKRKLVGEGWDGGSNNERCSAKKRGICVESCQSIMSPPSFVIILGRMSAVGGGILRGF